MEEYMVHIFSILKGIVLPHPFPVFTYDEITGKYNSESPNLLLDQSLRKKYAEYFELGLFPYFIIDFPLAVRLETGRPAPVRHLMARLRNGDENITDPLQQYTTGYDLVINGVEIGGGDLRNNSFDEQMKIFRKLDLDEKEIEQVYSTLLTALKSAVPPHGGFAIGIDRLVLALTSLQNIMDVVAFPKTHECICKLTASPA
jgi:aspartyl-tRNA synthetase